jgi:hypothetical protein
MNPGVAEQLVASRMEDLARARHGRLPSPLPGREFETSSAPRTRGALTRQVGVLLISIGRRLADGDRVPAFDVSNRR